MCGYDPFWLYDWQLDYQCALDMGLNSTKELYERMSDERHNNLDGFGIGTGNIRSDSRNE